MQFHALLLAAAASTTALAIPTAQTEGATLQKRNEVNDGEQSCIVEDMRAYYAYRIEIGAPYSEDADGAIEDALMESGMMFIDIGKWKNGHIMVYFDGPRESQDDVNSVMTELFPPSGGSYGNINGFNC